VHRVNPALLGEHTVKPVPTDPDRLPDSTDPSGPCSRCGRVSNFEAIASVPVTFDRSSGMILRDERGGYELDHHQQVSVLQCRGCGDCVVTVEDKLVGGVRGGQSGYVSWEGIFWWPPAGARTVGQDVPAEIARSYDEGMRCLSAGAPNGAVAMMRNTLAFIVQDKGSATAQAKGDLKDKLRAMVSEGTIHPNLDGWVTHVRLYGNAAAHPEQFGEVSAEEAQDVARLVHTLLELLYVLPGNIVRRQAERRA
jgi:hypothetical protein